ncbi:hypothetical protein GCM10010207_64480 [Streptomyces atratus]|nr:hypothetical protein GCM10010207_64480 [Streptomyces atratus]
MLLTAVIGWDLSPAVPVAITIWAGWLRGAFGHVGRIEDNFKVTASHRPAEQVRTAVPGLLPVRFSGPLAE